MGNLQFGRSTEWINCAKFLAIFAVLIDHTNGILYKGQSIALASYYSVSLFIIISGYLNYDSNVRHNLSFGKTIIRTCKKIVLAYLLASFIYVIADRHYFDFNTYLEAVFHFNASAPFYYVLLYLQLMIISKAIYKLLAFSEKYKIVQKILYDLILSIIILVVASLTTNYTNIMGIYGGGGKLFGGTYLFLFYVGMILNKYKVFRRMNRWFVIIAFVLGGIAYFILWRLTCNGYQPIIDSKVPMGAGFNPPSITFSLLAIFMMFLCFGFFNICSWNYITSYISKVVGFVGRHTLYIFLYHRLWLDFLIKYVEIDNIQIKRFVYYLIMISASIVFEYLVGAVKRCFNFVVGDSKINDTEC